MTNNVYVEKYWSQKLGRQVTKVGITGTSKALLMNDADVEHLITLLTSPGGNLDNNTAGK